MKLKQSAVAAAAALILATPSQVAAADFEVDFPAGQVCSFALHVSGTGGNSSVRHANGTVISAGTGSALTLSGNGNSLELRSNGSATRFTDNSDGTFSYQLMGHNVVFLFPTDVDGPSTTLIVGRAEINIDADGVWEIDNVAGRTTDICQTLS